MDTLSVHTMEKVYGTGVDMTDKEKKEYTECLNCDSYCNENECRSCNGYSKFKPNDETKVVFLEKENLELKKQVEELQGRIKNLKSWS